MINIPYTISAQFGYNVVSTNGEDEVVYHCPYCASRKGTPDTKGKLYVNTRMFIYHCFRCGASGHITVSKNINHNKTYHKDIVNNDDRLIKSINKLFDTDDIYKLKIPLKSIVDSPQALEYMLNRGFTMEQLLYYDLRVGTLDMEFGRVIIPNQVSKLIYTDFYAARSFIGQEPKYHNPFGINKSQIVFNLHRIKENDTIILVEGPLTAIAAGYHAVASLGKVLSAEQASQIAQKKPKRIYVNYDYGAEKESHEACKLLYSLVPEIPIYEVLMPDDRDAADLSKDEYADRLSHAKLYQPLLNDILGIL